jgi:hypothetical protein
MDFPILDLMDQDGCYQKLLDLPCGPCFPWLIVFIPSGLTPSRGLLRTSPWPEA